MDDNFSEIFIDKANEDFIAKALESSDFIRYLKPHLFDLLKRFEKIEKTKETISDIAKLIKKNECKIFESISEKYLLCGLIESVSCASHPRLGYLISKNDYPVPILYEFFNYQSQLIEYRINFDLFRLIITQTNKNMAIVSGTSNAVFKGKTSLIPLIFPGINEKSITKSNSYWESNYVDIICNDETSKDWIVADFHGKIEKIESLNLLKTLSAFAVVHFLNATMNDFVQNEPSSEIIKILKWYEKICQKYLKNIKIVFLIRDNEIEEFVIREIKMKLGQFYNEEFINVHTFKRLSECSSSDKRMISKELNIKELSQNKNFLYSIETLKCFYKGLFEDSPFINLSEACNELEKECLNLFNENLFNNNMDKFKEIFLLSHIDREIFDINNQINDNLCLFMSENIRDDKIENLLKMKNDLIEKRSTSEPLNNHIEYFLKLVLSENNYINLLAFEKYILEIKQENFISLINKKSEKMKEKQKLQTNIHKNSNGDEVDLKLKKIKSEIKRIEYHIEDIDITVDKFFDEIFLIIEWNDKNLKKAKRILEIENILVDKYIELVKQGFSIHFLRGRPFKLESRFLEMVFEKLKHENIFVLTVIGQQSSGKSLLLNALFGCDFRSSVGRCTTGIYMNYAKYKGNTIIILDTEGLQSLDAVNKAFDNQMTAMAVFSSQLVIINHKNEIDPNLENLLGIAFYAKLKTSVATFNPTIMFVLRDQNEIKNKFHIESQVAILRNKLNKQASLIKESIDDYFNIDLNNINLTNTIKILHILK